MSNLSNSTPLTYERAAQNQTVDTTLVSRVKALSVNASGELTVDFDVSLDPDAVAEVQTATVTDGTTGDLYILTIADDVDTAPFHALYVQGAGDTAATIATRLAARVSLSPQAKATASGAVITITSEYPGRNMTVAATGSTTPSNLALTTTVVPSGNSVIRRIMTVGLKMNVASDTRNPEKSGIPSALAKVNYYRTDGTTVDNPTAAFGRVGGSGTFTIDAFQTAAGIARE